MFQSTPYERKYLADGEFALVQESRHASMGHLDDTVLRELVGRGRDRRDPARGVASRQRREMRGKAAPSGALAASGNEGSRRKLDSLSAALKRANKETSCGVARSAKTELVTPARKALAMKRAADDVQTVPAYRTASQGMGPHADDKGRLRDNVDEGSFVPQLHQSRGDR